MFGAQTIDGALRARMAAPLSDDEKACAFAAGLSDDDVLNQRIIDVAASVPLTVSEREMCRMLEEPVSDFLAERNRLFAEAWLAKPPAFASDGAETVAAAGKAIAELTGRVTAPEVVLEAIGWRMSAERLPRVQALVERLKAGDAG